MESVFAKSKMHIANDHYSHNSYNNDTKGYFMLFLAKDQLLLLSDFRQIIRHIVAYNPRCSR